MQYAWSLQSYLAWKKSILSEDFFFKCTETSQRRRINLMYLFICRHWSFRRYWSLCNPRQPWHDAERPFQVSRCDLFLTVCMWPEHSRIRSPIYYWWPVFSFGSFPGFLLGFARSSPYSFTDLNSLTLSLTASFANATLKRSRHVYYPSHL